MKLVGFYAPVFRRAARGRTLAVSIWLLALTVTSQASPFDKWRLLSDREKTFLATVFSGDEAKAVEYAQVAGINVNSMAGEALSTWFYRLGNTQGGRERTFYRVTNVQRIVFERFKQNPNPLNIGESNLGSFCNYAPFPVNIHLEVSGTPDEKKAWAEQQETARKPQIDAMAAGFDSLIRYGLKDKAVINEIFKGCVFNSAAPLNAIFYDTVLSRMLKAGADINTRNGSQRPIEYLLKGANAPLVDRLVRDGAQVNYVVLENGLDKPDPAEPCQPRRYRSLYKFVFDWVRTRNQDEALRIIGTLAAAGLSPLTKYGFVENPNGTPICKYASFYDAVVDTGNLEFAKAIRAAAEPKTQPRMAQSAAQVQPAAPDMTRPVQIAAPMATSADMPTQIGAWRFIVEKGRPVAMATPEKPVADHLAGIRIECGTGGRLEYVPIALRLKPMTTLWVKGMDDIDYTIPLVANRVAGADNALLSKEFLGSEANYQRQGNGEKWGIEMSIDGPDTALAFLRMAGFSKVRSFMLANCKK